MSSSAQPAPDPTTELMTVLETLSVQAEEAALLKCTELGLDPTRGPVPLGESFINLRSSRLLLLDAAHKGHLTQLPLSVQRLLLDRVREVSRAISSLMTGRDEVVNLSKAIEDLHVFMWHYRVDSLSPELLGYQTKLNELKRLEGEISELRDQLKGGVTTRKRLDTIVEQSEAALKVVEKVVVDAADMAKGATTSLSQVKDLEQSVGALHKTVQQHDNNIATLASSSKASAGEIAAREQKILEFFDEISKFRLAMSEASDLQAETARKWDESAREEMDSNKTATGEILAANRALQDEIREHLQKAVGISLFTAFGNRQDALVGSKEQWFLRLMVTVALSFSLAAWLVWDLTSGGTLEYSPLFFLKLSLSFPLIYFIYFCGDQYKKERALEEEYAFKANISVSLIAYKELVEGLVKHENDTERQKYTDFIVGSINRIFEPPTPLVQEQKSRLSVEKMTKTVFDGAAKVAKAMPKP